MRADVLDVLDEGTATAFRSRRKSSGANGRTGVVCCEAMSISDMTGQLVKRQSSGERCRLSWEERGLEEEVRLGEGLSRMPLARVGVGLLSSPGQRAASPG